MGKVPKQARFYVVIRGRKTGIFNRWVDGAFEQINGFSDAKFKSFTTQELAAEWWRQNAGVDYEPVFHFETDLLIQATPEQPSFFAGGLYCVYLIIDPRNNKTFFVGQTDNIEQRQRNHLESASLSAKRAVRIKIAQLLSQGVDPAFYIVQRCGSETEAIKAETEWVKKCVSRGDDLCNHSRKHREIQALFGKLL